MWRTRTRTRKEKKEKEEEIHVPISTPTPTPTKRRAMPKDLWECLLLSSVYVYPQQLPAVALSRIWTDYDICIWLVLRVGVCARARACVCVCVCVRALSVFTCHFTKLILFIFPFLDIRSPAAWYKRTKASPLYQKNHLPWQRKYHDPLKIRYATTSLSNIHAKRQQGSYMSTWQWEPQLSKKHKCDLYKEVLRYPYCRQQPVNCFLKQKHRLQVRSSIICSASL
jgi:hypothetical protein